MLGQVVEIPDVCLRNVWAYGCVCVCVLVCTVHNKLFLIGWLFDSERTGPPGPCLSSKSHDWARR
jgi:hypothetical protein